MSNVETVQQIYGALARGDLPAILEKLADNVEWNADHSSEATPIMTPRRGRDAVGGFFESLGALDFKRFEPTAFLESDNIVVALINVTQTVKATGKTFTQEDEVHIWRFGPDGKVVNFRHRLDSHGQYLAFQP